MKTDNNKVSKDIVLGLAFVTGIGLLLILGALAVGMIAGSEADSNLIRGLLVGGALLMITGIGAWLGYVQPFSHFDDINQPMYHGHDHHDDHHDEEHAESESVSH